jgi:hypothetical protein
MSIAGELMKSSTFLATGLMLLLGPITAGAQQMQLEFQDGRVTLDAQDVPVRQILAEWARVGGATVVNGDKVMGAPVTLQLQGMPERQALDIVLRSVSGYMLAERRAGSASASAFDRILILPTSVGPRPQGPAPGANQIPQPGVRQMPPATPSPAEAVDDPDDEPASDVPDESEQEPQPVPPPNPRRGNFFPTPQGLQPPQPFNGMPGANPQEQQQGAPATTPTPGNPFGLPAGSSPVPGVVMPVPQPQPGQPGQQSRPPGQRPPEQP